MNGLVSIIVPVYNVEDYLDRCVKSVLNQTNKEFELILVDDGSPDTCPMLCDEWCKKDDRIIVVHKENGGLSDARNAGLKVAKGDFIVFIDSDDWISPFYLEYLLETMKKTKADIVECEILKTGCKTEHSEDIIKHTPIKYEVFETVQALKLLIQDTYFHQYVWNKLYKRSVVQDVLFEKGKTHEDEFWTYQVFGKARKIVKIKSILYYYFQRKNSIMGQQYSLKRLDSLEAKVQRVKYIEKNYPMLVATALENLWKSCIYQGQMSLLHLRGEELERAKKQIEEIFYRTKISLNIICKIPFRTGCWIVMAKFSFWGTCRVKNLLKRGL